MQYLDRVLSTQRMVIRLFRVTRLCHLPHNLNNRRIKMFTRITETLIRCPFRVNLQIGRSRESAIRFKILLAATKT